MLPYFKVAVDALNESISRRMQAVAGACAASQVEREQRARSDERQRIARELHDRVGETLSVGLRRLDLQEIYGAGSDPSEAHVARDTLVEAMRRLRAVMSGLREAPVRSLEKAFIEYLDSVQADAEVRLHISGDEEWAPPAILDEVFLITKEALRNALKHGAPRLVLIGAEVGRDELRAWVLDDGRGFVSATAASEGVGLAAMRERAALIGGRLAVLSMPGQGTRVAALRPAARARSLSASASHVRILIVDDHALAREGLRRILQAQEDMQVVGDAGDSAAAVMVAAREQPDIVLLDVEIPGGEAATTVRRIRDSSPGSRVIILSMYEGPGWSRHCWPPASGATCSSPSTGRNSYSPSAPCTPTATGWCSEYPGKACGTSSKGPGEVALSAREMEILGLVGQALSNSQIASRLSLKEATVKRHLRNIFVKLGAVSRIDAVNKAAELQVLPGSSHVAHR